MWNIPQNYSCFARSFSPFVIKLYNIPKDTNQQHSLHIIPVNRRKPNTCNSATEIPITAYISKCNYGILSPSPEINLLWVYEASL